MLNTIGKNRTAEKPILAAALAYHRAGFHPIPISQGKKAPPLIKEWNKPLPTGKAGEEKIRSWFGQWPNANLGIVCGNGLAVVDVDSERATLALEKELGGIPGTLTVKTDNGVHFFFRCPPDQASFNPRLPGGEKEEVKAWNTYVLSPPSVVEKTGRARCFENGNLLDGLDALAELPCLFRKHKRPPLVEKIREQFSKHPTKEGWKAHRPLGYRSRSEAEMASALALVNAGWPESEILAEGRSWPKYREISSQGSIERAEGYLSHTLRMARARFIQFPPEGCKGKKHAEKAERAMNSFSWPCSYTIRSGKWRGMRIRGDTLRRVYTAHIVIAKRWAGETDYGADVRTISQLARASMGTASKANAALIEMSLLRRAKWAEGTTAAKYNLFFFENENSGCVSQGGGENENSIASTKEHEKDLFSNSPPVPPGHDVFRGLPPSNHGIWARLLSHGPERTKPLARRLGLDPATVRAGVGRMEPLGLVKRSEEGLWHGVPHALDELDALAVRMGADGKAEKVRERHRREREYHSALHSFELLGVSSALMGLGFSRAEIIAFIYPDHFDLRESVIRSPFTGEAREITADAEKCLLEWLKVRGPESGPLYFTDKREILGRMKARERGERPGRLKYHIERNGAGGPEELRERNPIYDDAEFASATINAEEIEYQ